MEESSLEMPIGRSAYFGNFHDILIRRPDAILGILASGQTGDLTPAQRDAWLRQIEIQGWL